MKEIFFNGKKSLNLKGNLLSLHTPIIMGILNATPDSFFADSRAQSQEAILKKVETMIADGATIIDIGGYSTRPHAMEVSELEEMQRVIWVVELLKNNFPNMPLSIDTFRASVAKAAINNGAHVINDISGGQMDEKMFETAADLQVPYVLTHTRGTPQIMMQLTNYDYLLKEMLDYFEIRISKLYQLGVKDIVLDLGFGFAKTIDQNFELIRQLEVFKMFNLPLLVGVSRKSMVYKTLNCTVDKSLNGTTVLHTAAILLGASILRVHDVKAAQEAIVLCEKLNLNNRFLNFTN